MASSTDFSARPGSVVPLSARRNLAVSAAVSAGLLTEDLPVTTLLDLRSIREAADSLHTAFAEVAAPGQQVLHTFAVKAGALVPVLRLLNGLDIGCEVASPGELALARAAGVPADRTVLDSPAKTITELTEALSLGIALNVDNPQELDRLDGLIGSGIPLPGAPASPIGMRVNPQLGAGSIDAMSTATATSKFGVALSDPGAREWILRAFAERPWLTALHCHVGSQGMPLEQMAAGVRATHQLAEEINAAAIAAGGRPQVDTLDIGGGLPVNFGSDATRPGYGYYARLLRAEVPGLFDGRYRLITEFGRSLLAKSGVILARVEYTKDAGGRRIAVTHAGAQVATRTVFAPESWPLRVAAYDAQGRPRAGGEMRQDVAGPCCFAGDLVARDRALPELHPGDLAALLDTGAYYAATPFGYNSLPRPGIYGFTVGPGDAEGPADGVHGPDAVEFSTIRRPQTIEELIAESGG
jgi:diaminopimelate decarboxylase